MWFSAKLVGRMEGKAMKFSWVGCSTRPERCCWCQTPRLTWSGSSIGPRGRELFPGSVPDEVIFTFTGKVSRAWKSRWQTHPGPVSIPKSVWSTGRQMRGGVVHSRGANSPWCLSAEPRQNLLESTYVVLVLEFICSIDKSEIPITAKRFNFATNKSLICICVPPQRSITADLFKRDAKTSDKTLLCHRLMTVVNLISLGWNKILISYNDSPRPPLYPDTLHFLCVCVFFNTPSPLVTVYRDFRANFYRSGFSLREHLSTWAQVESQGWKPPGGSATVAPLILKLCLVWEVMLVSSALLTWASAFLPLKALMRQRLTYTSLCQALLHQLISFCLLFSVCQVDVLLWAPPACDPGIKPKTSSWRMLQLPKRIVKTIVCAHSC